MIRVRLASPLTLLISVVGIGALGCSAATPAPEQSRQEEQSRKPESALQKLSRAEAPALTAIKPPANPKVSHHFISERNLAALPVPQQSPELAKALADLQTGSVDARVAKLKAKVYADMVYVQGGRFMRGDFAKLMGIDGVTRMTYNSDDKVVKEVTLSDFWISKYKVTYAEFDVFADATKRQRAGMESEGGSFSFRHPLIPAHNTWKEAKAYCQWLGSITDLPVDLPTEAQWEYAARSRGQFFMIPTDDGTIDFGRNLPFPAQESLLSSKLGGHRLIDSYPVGLFPPNPLGLFDMSENGLEWVDDWYAKDAYSKTQSQDPRGPETGTRKVVRSWGGDSLKIGVSVWRRSEDLTPTTKDEGSGKAIPAETPFLPGLRCAVSPR